MRLITFQDLQVRKLSEVAKLLGVDTEQLKTFLSKVVITKSHDRLRLGSYNKLKKKKWTCREWL